MIYPSADKLDALGSKYALVIIAAKRARQIKDHARKLVDTNSLNPITVALEEIAEGEIVPLLVGDLEKMPTRVSATPVLGGLNATFVDEEEMVERGHRVDDISALLSDPEAIHLYEPESSLSDEALQVDEDGLEVDAVEVVEEDSDSVLATDDDISVIVDDIDPETEDSSPDKE